MSLLIYYTQPYFNKFAHVRLRMIIFIILLVATISHIHVKLETIATLELLIPLNLPYTTGKYSLVGQIDKVEVLSY